MSRTSLKNLRTKRKALQNSGDKINAQANWGTGSTVKALHMNAVNHFISLLHRSADNKCGFTLIEIVVALAILSLALPTLLHSFTMAARGQALSQNRTTALYLLKFRMAEIEIEGYPDIGDEDGEFGDNSRFRWHSEVQDVEPEEIEGLRFVTVTVTWQEQGKEKSISMNTYIADHQMQQTQGGQQNQGVGGG